MGLLNLVVINAVYPPEPMVSAQMGRDLAVYLVESGSQVTVLCPVPSRPMGANYSSLQKSLEPLISVESGVTVVRLPSFVAPQSRLFARMRESWSFGRQACRYLEKHLQSVNVVYANTWPLLSQALVARYCARRRIPLVLHIQDVYPESLMGKLPRVSRRVIGGPLWMLDRWSAQQAQQVVVISDNMRRTYVENRGLAPGRVTTVLNWVDDQRFAHTPSRRDACARYRIPEDKFTFLYLGNIGPVAGVEGLIHAFHKAGLPQAQLVVVGDGSAKTSCVALADRLGLGNVRFVSDPEAANVPLLQSLGHVCLLPVRKGAAFSSIPSKLMAYMLAGKPVLATVDLQSDTAQCVHAAQCGWVGGAEDIDWLAAKMTELFSYSSATLEAIGDRGRTYGSMNFSKGSGVNKLANVMFSVQKQ